jgi:hypothetical protein
MMPKRWRICLNMIQSMEKFDGALVSMAISWSLMARKSKFLPRRPAMLPWGKLGVDIVVEPPENP